YSHSTLQNPQPFPTRRSSDLVSSMMGESAITDGKVEGDTLTFTITGKFGDQEMKLSYSGKINGNEIKMKSEVQGGGGGGNGPIRSEEHTSELQSRVDLVCRLL